ncbi:MAG: acyl-CoA/acyl-ACP dehydrogenase [Deltaproteobacteria bacterium]|nr:MAG: acyl-CoA/acyl-ACP dehydrogenase [Deltaproteobacteria bacterium]
MDFNLSEEQEALQETARDFLRERWPPDRTREALDRQPAVIDDAVWREIVEMGWLGVAASEAAGGIGGDVLTAAVLAQEAGRGVLPGPFESSLIAAIALERSGDDEACRGLLTDLIAGQTRVTLAIDEPGGLFGPDAVASEAVAGRDGWRLSGDKILVPDADGALLLLVAARTPDGPGLVRLRSDAEGVAIKPMSRMDAQACAEIVFENALVEGGARLGGARGEALLREVYDIWTVLLAADLLGSAEASLELSTQYARERVQFGKPIGSFQAVSHRLANNLVDVEIGRSLLYGACLALDEKRENAAALVSAAKAWLSDTAVSAAESALQVHGGVGFTWEYDVHLHMRRARCNAALLGDADFHRDRVATYMDASWVPPAKP